MSPLPAEVDPVVVREMYPSTVHLPDGAQVHNRLVLVTHHRVYVYGHHSSVPQPDLVAEYRMPERPQLAGLAGSSTTPIRLTLADGAEFHAERGAGCGGCGAVLSSWRPFSPYRMGPLP